MSSLVPIAPLAIVVLSIIGMWTVYTKAGRHGWAAIIPFYNFYTACKVAGHPGWWLVFAFIPIANIVVWIVVAIGIAKRFGRGTGFGVGLALLTFIFAPILGLGDDQYQPSRGIG